MLFNALLCFISLSLAKAGENTYIIAFKKDEKGIIKANSDSVINLFAEKGTKSSVKYNYVEGFQGMAVEMDDTTLAKAKKLPNIDYIFPDGIAYGAAMQHNSTWGLSRISHRNKQPENEVPEYLYDKNAGKGVTIYVVDSGINTNHTDFGGRASWGANFVNGSPDTDEHGHGTHCAGTAASNTYGVAKKSKLVAVKVLGYDNRGWWSDIIAGVQWVVKNADPANSIISFSVGGDIYPPMDDAINAAYEAGFFVSVAAMNDYKDACDVSPARAKHSFTVGATDINDQKASFSNWGKCVDISAPGVDVLSTGTASNTASRVMSGTSMATPHVAGIAATFLSQGIKCIDLKTKILNTATKGAIIGLYPGTPNLLAYNGYSKY